MPALIAVLISLWLNFNSFVFLAILTGHLSATAYPGLLYFRVNFQVVMPSTAIDSNSEYLHSNSNVSWM